MITKLKRSAFLALYKSGRAVEGVDFATCGMHDDCSACDGFTCLVLFVNSKVQAVASAQA